MNIESKVVFVTGANRGIGASLVQAFLAKGARRVYAAARNPASVAFHDERVQAIGLDVTDLASIQNAAQVARDTQILVNNAGVLDWGNLLEAPRDSFQKNLAVNLWGPLDMDRAFVPVLEQNGDGAIVTILTLLSLASMPGMSAYNASKAAAWSVGLSLRATLAAKSIAVFNVFPGAVDTDMLAGVEMPKTASRDVAQNVLSGLEAGSEDIFPDPCRPASMKAGAKTTRRLKNNSQPCREGQAFLCGCPKMGSTRAGSLAKRCGGQTQMEARDTEVNAQNTGQGGPAWVVPQRLYGAPGVRVLAAEKDSAIVYKELQSALHDRTIFARTASLTIVLSGRKEIVLSARESLEVRAGEALFLPPDLFGVSDLFTPREGSFRQYLLFFEPAILREFLSRQPVRMASRATPPGYRFQASRALLNFLKGLDDVFGSLERRASAMLRLKLLEALELLHDQDPERGFVDWLFRISTQRLRDLTELMNQHYDKGLGVSDYALLSGRSLSTFQRDFKRTYGRSPGKWLQEKRLEKARQLLEQGEASITDIAFEIGYENVSHFIRLFRKAYGHSPARYRKEMTG